MLSLSCPVLYPRSRKMAGSCFAIRLFYRLIFRFQEIDPPHQCHMHLCRQFPDPVHMLELTEHIKRVEKHQQFLFPDRVIPAFLIYQFCVLEQQLFIPVKDLVLKTALNRKSRFSKRNRARIAQQRSCFPMCNSAIRRRLQSLTRALDSCQRRVSPAHSSHD